VSAAHIIYVPGNQVSETLADRCLKSCQQINYPAVLYAGFDGTGTELQIPEHIRNQSWYRWLRVTDHYQSLAEIACSLSHIALWVKCMTDDQPLVILEHDAIMIKPYLKHEIYNGIAYLGSQDQFSQPTQKKLIPMYSSINRNWNFIHRAHAYSIDPAAARKLFSRILDRGIYESADVMIRADDVAIIQTDFYAYDRPGETIIKTRKK
jgi:hypothetical protein